MSLSRDEIAKCIWEVLNKIASWPVEGEDKNSLFSDYVLFRFIDLKLLLMTLEFILDMRAQQASNNEFRVLDAGTSIGVVPLTLKRLGINAFACDDPREKRFKPFFEHEGVPYLSFDLINGDLPYPDEFFDIVVFKDVIEHLPFSPKKNLESFHRILKRDGSLILEEPNLSRLSSRIRLLFGRSVHPPLDYFFNSEFPFPGHHREYTLAELEQMLDWTGFKPIKSIYADHHDILFLWQQKKRFRNNRVGQVSWKMIFTLSLWHLIDFFRPSLSPMISIVAKKKQSA